MGEILNKAKMYFKIIKFIKENEIKNQVDLYKEIFRLVNEEFLALSTRDKIDITNSIFNKIFLATDKIISWKISEEIGERKGKKELQPEEVPSWRQIKFAMDLGIPEYAIWGKTKKEVGEIIQKTKSGEGYTTADKYKGD